MNVDDFEVSPLEEKVKCRIEWMFLKQRELMRKYHPIEFKSGLMQTEKVPVDIDSREGQARLKDFSWRVTEELAEALEAYQIHPDQPNHYFEELIDALHFITELCILANVTPEMLGQQKDFHNYSEVDEMDCMLEKFYFVGKKYNFFKYLEQVNVSDVRINCSFVVEEMGKSMNCLKNKPWKQSHLITDKQKFNKLLCKAYWSMIFMIMDTTTCDHSQLFEMYDKKNQVNNFRQESQY